MKRDCSIWIVNGIPGAGKTTTARTLASHLGNLSVHIEGDAIHRMIVNGYSQPTRDGGGDRQLELSISLQCALARGFMVAGYNIVLDFVISSRSRLKQYVQLLEPYDVHHVVLAPQWEVARARMRDDVATDDWHYLTHELVEEFGPIGVWIDNSALSVDGVCRELLSRSSASLVSRSELSASS